MAAVDTWAYSGQVVIAVTSSDCSGQVVIAVDK